MLFNRPRTDKQTKISSLLLSHRMGLTPADAATHLRQLVEDSKDSEMMQMIAELCGYQSP